LKFVLYKLNDNNTAIIVDKISDETDYDKFVEALPAEEPRWAVYDFPYEVEGGQRSKLIFYSWAPDTAKIKKKMLHASSQDSLKNQLVGVNTFIQGTDYSEVAHEVVLEKVTKK